MMKALEDNVLDITQQFRGRAGPTEEEDEFKMEVMADYLQEEAKPKRVWSTASQIKEKQCDEGVIRNVPKEQRKSDQREAEASDKADKFCFISSASWDTKTHPHHQIRTSSLL